MAQAKSNLTNVEYQSTFLPLIEQTNIKIKKLILESALLNKSVSFLRKQIEAIINLLDKKLPKELKDKEIYLLGVRKSADKMITKTYRPILLAYTLASALLIRKGIKLHNEPKTPLEMYKYIDTIKDLPRDLWAERKGAPYMESYGRKVRKYVKELAEQEILTGESGSKITIWQKAELDIRYDNQMQMLDNLHENGVKLAWISSHPDCSKRCEKWQGKLVDLENHAVNSGFRMDYKVDGNTVYSLTDIMDQVDKYGYHNNIICGFNCRHHLEPYKKGSKAPKEFTARDIKAERKINANLREMERRIRNIKQEAKLYVKIDMKRANILKDKAELLTRKYKEYANKNGFAWYDYRIKI